MKKKILYTLLNIVLFLELFCFGLIPVLKETFPLEKIEAVLFTLSQNTDGSQAFVISLALGALKKSFVIFALVSLLAAAIPVVFRQLKKRGILKVNRTPTYLQVTIVLVAVVLFSLIKTAFAQLPIINYILAWDDINAVPEHSEFYQKEYVNPDSVQIKFNQKRNLILIFLESMEYNYQDSANGGNLPVNLIPEITSYMQNEQSFLPGGAPAFGMGWTMAAVVAKTCGIPLNFPPRIKNSFTPLKSFIPGTTCLTDILAREGYNTAVSQGSNIKFSGMNDFLNTHSNPHIFDLITYDKNDKVKKDEKAQWGVLDSLHYEFSKTTIGNLASNEKPWAIWMFTMDTHSPHGFLDKTCEVPDNTPEKKQYPYILKCASRQVDKFIKWAQTQDWYENTTIAVMGDHATAASPETVGFTEPNITHYWLDFFINSAIEGKGGHRKFTSLDMYPTILESIGAEIPDGALGLGRSLYLANPTLLEKYGQDSLDNALKKRSLEYNYFLYGPHK